MQSRLHLRTHTQTYTDPHNVIYHPPAVTVSLYNLCSIFTVNIDPCLSRRDQITCVSHKHCQLLDFHVRVTRAQSPFASPEQLQGHMWCRVLLWSLVYGRNDKLMEGLLLLSTNNINVVNLLLNPAYEKFVFMLNV